MRNVNYKVKCLKKKITKSKDIFKAYNDIQYAYVDILEQDEEVVEIKSNVLLDGLSIEGKYTTDFVCTLNNGDIRVRECVFKKHLTKPMTVKLLDESRDFWLKRGVHDWGVVINAS